MSPKARRKKYNWFGLGAIFTLLVLAAFFILQKSLIPYCANSISCKESFNLKVENDAVGVFNGEKIDAPSIDLAAKPSAKILGEATGTGEKHIYVDLTNQTLTADQGGVEFMKVPISSGKWFPTPTGDFEIWEKLRATKMSGGQGADYYYLPNVPFVMFFAGSGVAAGRGFSLHGTYWHNNFGHPMSHGCVNMRIIDAEKLYYWVNPIATGSWVNSSKDNPGTKITIYGQAPL